MIDFIKKIPYTLRRYKMFMPEDIMRKVQYPVNQNNQNIQHNVNVRTLWNRVEGKAKDELCDVVLE